jgi:HEAT repeat protein
VTATPEGTPLPPPPKAMPPRTAQRPVVVSGLLPEGVYAFETDLKIEALAGLLDSHSERVIPLLREIALDRSNPADARRAVFTLARSSRADAKNTVAEVATQGQGPVRMAAIREISRFPEPAYVTTLLRIARNESDPAVRDTAIVSLGRNGSPAQLRSLYAQTPPSSRYAVLTALFNAKADDELIRIARTERDQRLRLRARQQLRLLGTPSAIKFLEDNP